MIFNTNKKKAEKLLKLALELESEGKEDDAIAVYLKIVEEAPNWSVPFYNLGLIYKYRKDWHNSLEFNRKSCFFNPNDGASFWNLGIAATALRDWSTARLAWKVFGIKMPEGDAKAELRMDIGMTPVRLLENSEVVWTDRIDPARAIIQNVPTKDSNRRFRDIVLNDGAPNGQRILEGRKYDVFDELELFEPSNYSTFSLWVEVKSDTALNELEKIFEERDLGFENWTHSIRYLCRQCSEGVPHEHHDKELTSKVLDCQYQLGLAATTEKEIRGIILDWQKNTHSEVSDFEQLM